MMPRSAERLALCVSIAMVLSSAPAVGQSPAIGAVAPGARVRVSALTIPRELTGRLRTPIVDTMSLDVAVRGRRRDSIGPVERFAIPIASIRRLEVSHGRSFSAGAKRGARLGGLVGGAAWAGLVLHQVATAKDDEDWFFPSRESKIGAAAVLGLVFPIVGTGGGAIVGGLVGRERWQRVFP